MSSSILAVEIGSSAEVGSSSNTISGLTATARAMHRRCCWPPESDRPLSCFLTIFAGITMVSNVMYYSGKDINLRRGVPFVVAFALALGFALVSSYPPGILFALFLCYAASGYVLLAWRWTRPKSAPRTSANGG